MGFFFLLHSVSFFADAVASFVPVFLPFPSSFGLNAAQLTSQRTDVFFFDVFFFDHPQDGLIYSSTARSFVLYPVPVQNVYRQ